MSVSKTPSKTFRYAPGPWPVNVILRCGRARFSVTVVQFLLSFLGPLEEFSYYEHSSNWDSIESTGGGNCGNADLVFR